MFLYPYVRSFQKTKFTCGISHLYYSKRDVPATVDMTSSRFSRMWANC